MNKCQKIFDSKDHHVISHEVSDVTFMLTECGISVPLGFQQSSHFFLQNQTLRTPKAITALPFHRAAGGWR